MKYTDWIEGFPGVDAERDNCPVAIAIVVLSYRLILFLPRSIPDLKLDFQSIYVNNAPYKIYANGHDVVIRKFVLAVPN